MESSRSLSLLSVGDGDRNTQREGWIDRQEVRKRREYKKEKEREVVQRVGRGGRNGGGQTLSAGMQVNIQRCGIWGVTHSTQSR